MRGIHHIYMFTLAVGGLCLLIGGTSGYLSRADGTGQGLGFPGSAATLTAMNWEVPLGGLSAFIRKQGVILMVMSSHLFMRMTGCVCLTAVVCLMVSCSGGYYTTNENGEKKVYRVDGQGTKTLVYETDQQGKTTIHDADDPMAKRQAAAQGLAAEFSANRTEQLEQLSRAPKRQANDPIYVDLAPAVLDEQMQKAERAKGAVAEQIRSEFMEDPIIKLVDRSQTRSGLLKPHVSASPDVEVSPKVSLKEAYGIDRKTGKPNKVLAVVFEATIISQVPPATYNVSESGHALKNLEVSKRFAKHVKQVILEKIGPSIPAH